MAYYIGQFFGILVLVCTLVGNQLPKKWMMITVALFTNVFAGLNVLLLGQIGSAVVVNVVAVIQTLVALWHEHKKTKVSLAEKIIFFVAYVGCGLLGCQSWMDILPVAGALMFLLSIFAKHEQGVRAFTVANAIIWIVYYVLIGSSTLFAQIGNLISNLIALWRYRARPEKSQN